MYTSPFSERYIQKMKALLGNSFAEYAASCSQPPCFGLRVNTLKSDPDTFYNNAAKAGWKLERISWIPNGFYYGEEMRPGRHPWYSAGLYYLQEPSAMTPAAVLGVKPGERALDLCAAPGGKSTELAAGLKGEGVLFANDVSASRARALLKNLELFGASNICVLSETPERLSARFPGFFDKILVDAPCSGEGMFRRDPGMAKSYEERGPEYYIPLQRQILSEAVRMLAPGGRLLYSTCTFDEEENEGCIRFALDAFPEMRLAEIEKKDGFSPGIGMPECVRLFPHRIRGEGHFLALLEKTGSGTGEAAGGDGGSAPLFGDSCRAQECFGAGRALRGALGTSRADGRSGGREALPGVSDALRFVEGWGVRGRLEPGRVRLERERLYYLPEELCKGPAADRSGLRYLRTGLLLGELKRGRFEPSQALAMALPPGDGPGRLMLSSGDERVIRYLKGETISLSEDACECGIQEAARGGAPSGGWRLVCVDGFPLGWGRLHSNMLKNKYYPGWRWQ